MLSREGNTGEWGKRTIGLISKKATLHFLVTTFMEEMYLFYKYWDLSTQMTVMKNRSVFVSTNQRREQWNFTSEKSLFAVSDWMNNVFH